MNTIRQFLAARSTRKAARDLAVIGVPAALIWIVGHPVELGRAGLDEGEVVKVTAYATSVLAIWRFGRAYLGRGPV